MEMGGMEKRKGAKGAVLPQAPDIFQFSEGRASLVSRLK
jgi:hypothetical protein